MGRGRSTQLPQRPPPPPPNPSTHLPAPSHTHCVCIRAWAPRLGCGITTQESGQLIPKPRGHRPFPSSLPYRSSPNGAPARQTKRREASPWRSYTPTAPAALTGSLPLRCRLIQFPHPYATGTTPTEKVCLPPPLDALPPPPPPPPTTSESHIDPRPPPGLVVCPRHGRIQPQRLRLDTTHGPQLRQPQRQWGRPCASTTGMGPPAQPVCQHGPRVVRGRPRQGRDPRLAAPGDRGKGDERWMHSPLNQRLPTHPSPTHQP